VKIGGVAHLLSKLLNKHKIETGIKAKDDSTSRKTPNMRASATIPRSRVMELFLTRNPESEPVRCRKMLEQIIVSEPSVALEVHRFG
jgi:hypothetical protein